MCSYPFTAPHLHHREPCSVAIQILPQMADDDAIAVIDKVIAYIRSLELNMVVGPFETVVEGDFDKLMNMVRECLLICVRNGAPQVISYIKVFYAPTEGVLGIAEKIDKHAG